MKNEKLNQEFINKYIHPALCSTYLLHSYINDICDMV